MYANLFLLVLCNIRAHTRFQAMLTKCWFKSYIQHIYICIYVFLSVSLSIAMSVSMFLPCRKRFGFGDKARTADANWACVAVAGWQPF